MLSLVNGPAHHNADMTHFVLMDTADKIQNYRCSVRVIRVVLWIYPCTFETE